MCLKYFTMRLFRTSLKGFIYLNILVLLLTIVNTIPRSLIDDNLVKTSEYMANKEDRYYLFKDFPQSNVDVVTDCIAFNIINNVDESNVIRSTLESNYYLTGRGYSHDLTETVKSDASSNFSYMQYWHGYNIVLRILLLFTSYVGIKHVIIIAFVFLLAILILHKPSIVKLFLVTSLSICSIWFNLNTICHTAPLFIALIGCIVIDNKKSINWTNLFMYLGISTAFFDFLSTETLTLTLPLVFVIVRLHRSGECLRLTKFLSICTSWFIGYTMTFIYKWLLCTFLLDTSYFELAVSRGYEEIITESSVTSGIALNISMLLPFTNSSNTALIIFISCVLLLIIVSYLFHKNNCNKNNVITYLVLISTIPYIRYLLIPNHSIYHYFFTYRAQIASLLCVLVILNYVIDFKLIRALIRKE